MAKSKWDDVKEKLESVEIWASMGLNERQIAHNLGISKATMENYKKAHLDFLEHLKRGKETADSKVENALYKRATGYTVIEQQAMKRKEIYYDEKDRKCEKEHIEVVEVEKEVPADVTAMKFWLINRQKGRWTDNPHKVEIDKKTLKLREKEVEMKEW